MEKWSLSQFKKFMGFMIIQKLHERSLTPSRYRVQKFVQTKKRALTFSYIADTLAGMLEML